MVTSRKMQALDQAILCPAGIEPADCPITALKPSARFRAGFAFWRNASLGRSRPGRPSPIRQS